MATAATVDSPKEPLAVPVRVGGEPAAGPDPQLVADMKLEIRTLVQEISQLASQEIGPEDFYAGFLTRVVGAMAAVGGAVWTTGDSGRLKLQHQVNFRETGAEATPQARTRHGLLIKSVLGGTQAILVPPGAGSGSEQAAANPTPSLLVLAPLIVEKQAVAVVEIFQRAGGGPSTQRGYLRFLVQMCDVACDYLKTRRLRQLGESQELWQQLESFVTALHRSLDVTATAYAVVNEGRRLIGCDRVALALTYGGRCRVEAVSGLDTIDRRAGEVQRLAALADAVLRTGEPLWSDAGQEELPPQIQQPLQAYIDQSHARLVAVLPLVPADPEAGAEAGERREGGRPQRPIGVLIVEQLRDARQNDVLRQRSQVVAQHSAAALVNSIEHSSLFLLPVWKALGQATWIFRGRTLPKTLLALVLAAGGVVALATVQTDFEVAARGKLQPALRHEIFAPLDGVVTRVPVEHGQIVEAGAILAELTSTDLDLQLAALIGRQTTNEERLAAVQRAMLDPGSGPARLSPLEQDRLAGELLELRQEAQNIERELALLREKQRQLTIAAPQRGQVITWKVRDLLLQRPVSRGQGLLTLANPDGPWELELYLPERRLMHVQASGKRKLPDVAASAFAPQREADASRSPDVTFALSSHPGQTFHGRVVEIEQAAEVRGDEGNTVLVRVAVDRQELPPLHDQTTVTAKLNCGRTSVGYAWFCDLIETVRTKVLFWLPSYAGGPPACPRPYALTGRPEARPTNIMPTLAIALLALAAPPLVSSPASPPGKQVQLTHCLVSLLADVQVPALEAGALTAVEVSEGQPVTAGQLLARIDDRQPQLDKLAAELQRDAALAKAQDDIEVRFAVAAEAVAVAELERALAIERRSPGGITQQEIQKLQLAKHRDELQIEKSKLDMRVARMNADVHQAAVKSAEAALVRRQIVAPLDGVVVALLHDKGEWVAAGESVVQVVRIDRLRVEGLVSGADYSPDDIAGRPVTVEVPLAGGRIGRFPGKVVFISPLVAAGNSYRVRAEVENRIEEGHPLLRPGMTATMTIALEGVSQATRSIR